MKVFVLMSTYIDVDSGEYESRVDGVYESVEDANKQMQQEIKDTRTDFKNYDTEEDNYVEGDMTWSIWEKDCYMSHSCVIKITQCEII